jgi:hypothetical protein
LVLAWHGSALVESTEPVNPSFFVSNFLHSRNTHCALSSTSAPPRIQSFYWCLRVHWQSMSGHYYSSPQVRHVCRLMNFRDRSAESASTSRLETVACLSSAQLTNHLLLAAFSRPLIAWDTLYTPLRFGRRLMGRFFGAHAHLVIYE